MTPNNNENNNEVTPTKPDATQSRGHTPPPVPAKRRRNAFETPLADFTNLSISAQSPVFKSPEPKRLIPVFDNQRAAADDAKSDATRPSAQPKPKHGAPAKKRPIEDSPSGALELSPGRGDRRFNIMETPPDIPRNEYGTSENTNKTLDLEYDYTTPQKSNDNKKKKRKTMAEKSKSVVDANIAREYRNGGARIIKDKKTGETLYGLLDKKSGSEKIYKYKKNFEKAVLKQKGGFDILSALGLSTNPTKTAPAPASKTRASPSNHRQGAPRQPVTRQTVPRQPAPRQSVPRQPVPRQSAPRQSVPRQPVPRQSTPQQLAPRQSAPQQLAPRQSAPRQPTANSTHGPQPTMVAPTKIPSDQYKVNRKGGYPEKVYEYYMPKTRRKRFLLIRTQPNKVYDQLNNVSVDRLVKGIVGFPGKTLDRATGQFLK